MKILAANGPHWDSKRCCEGAVKWAMCSCLRAVSVMWEACRCHPRRVSAWSWGDVGAGGAGWHWVQGGASSPRLVRKAVTCCRHWRDGSSGFSICCWIVSKTCGIFWRRMGVGSCHEAQWAAAVSMAGRGSSLGCCSNRLKHVCTALSRSVAKCLVRSGQIPRRA